MVLNGCLNTRWDTATASNGKEGLHMATVLQPDLIITDIRMPEMDGETLLRELRSTPELGDTPVVVITAIADRARTVRLLELGAQDVLHKPVLFPEVRARVAALLDAKKTREILIRTVGKKEVELVRLAEQIAERTRSLESALDELRIARREADSAGRIKSNFLRMMGHELKTPIAAIQLQLHLLQREDEPRSSQLGSGLARIDRSNRRLVHLIDTCMEWARVESGRSEPQFRSFDLAESVMKAVEIVSNLARQGAVTVNLTEHPRTTSITSDPRVVGLLLINLLNYAVQNSIGGGVRVDLSEGRGHWYVGVTDSSRPLSERQREVALSPLPSDDDPQRAAGSGSGIALYVIRDIAHAIDGELEFGPPHPDGNTYILSLCDQPLSEEVSQAGGGAFGAGREDLRGQPSTYVGRGT
jgi:two-component system sensor histidine kinase/response regulator